MTRNTNMPGPSLPSSLLLMLLLLLLPLSSVAQNYYNSRITYGEGYGLFYSGLGTNIGIHSDNDFKYFSVGCMQTDVEEEVEEEFHQGGGSSANAVPACGTGFGWVRALDTGSKTGVSFYLGMVDAKVERNPYTREVLENQAVYGLGLGYVWFPAGMGNPGMNIGFFTSVARYDSHFTNRMFFQLGFQH